jgi:hypothetical protein
MPKYIIAAHGGKEFKNPEEEAEYKEKMMEWYNGIVEAIVDPGAPLLNSKIVKSSGVSDGGESRLTGYSMIIAESMEDALELVKGCPHLDIGTMEVAEVMEM